MNQTAPQTESERPQASFLKRLFGRRPTATLRTVIDDYISKSDDSDSHIDQDAAAHALIANVLQLAELTAFDVMIPRADIIAIPHDITREELIEFIRTNPRSRFPVYQSTLDDIIGTIHIKDLFLVLAPNDGEFNLAELIRDVPIISPALPVMDLLHDMRTTRRHMMMVVDEFGGIDGLVTAGDVVEAVIGRLDDEHDSEERPRLVKHEDGNAVADGLLPIEEFQGEYGDILTEDELDTVDTLGGYVMHLAGRIPLRGEVITHESGIEFTILEADPRRVLSLLIRQPGNQPDDNSEF